MCVCVYVYVSVSVSVSVYAHVHVRVRVLRISGRCGWWVKGIRFVPLSYQNRSLWDVLRRGSHIPLHPLVTVYKIQISIPPSSDGMWLLHAG